jgi:hypothetical protein
MDYIRSSRLPLLCLITMALSGCQSLTSSPKSTKQPPSGQASISQSGYRLLYDLLGDEKNVSKLLLIKHERQELGTLIKEISGSCAAAYKQLDGFVKADPSLDVKTEVLPPAERLTREQISKDRAKELLKAKGKDFETSLLLTQLEALAYGSHLSAVLAQSERVAPRQQFLLRLARQLEELHGKAVALLLAHYS